VHTRALLTLTCASCLTPQDTTGDLSVRGARGCPVHTLTLHYNSCRPPLPARPRRVPGACPTTLPLTLTLTKEHPQGYLSYEEGPLSIHTIATRAASLSRSRAGGHELEVTAPRYLVLDT